MFLMTIDLLKKTWRQKFHAWEPNARTRRPTPRANRTELAAQATPATAIGGDATMWLLGGKPCPRRWEEPPNGDGSPFSTSGFKTRKTRK